MSDLDRTEKVLTDLERRVSLIESGTSSSTGFDESGELRAFKINILGKVRAIRDQLEGGNPLFLSYVSLYLQLSCSHDVM